MQQYESPRGQLLAEVEAIAPILAEHAPESEKLGRLDEATLEALRKTRLLRFLCPRDLGGDEADPVTQLEVLEALAWIDASASWVTGVLRALAHMQVLSCPPGALNGFLPRMSRLWPD